MSRQYPVPKRFKADVPDVDYLSSERMERISQTRGDTPLGEWATNVLRGETKLILDKIIRDDGALPLGILNSNDGDIVVGLAYDDEWFDGDDWHDGPCDCETIDLDEDTVAFVASALTDGMDGVVLRAAIPLAFVGAATDVKPAGTTELPDGSIVIAVVDDMDRDAVLDLLAIAPGPVVHRRNDGEWYRDDAWLRVLRSIKPPPVVQLDDSNLEGVILQVDEATAGDVFDDNDAEQYTEMRSSLGMSASLSEMHWLDRIDRETDMAYANEVIVAASRAANSIKGHALGAERLRQYWTTGEGALKIRWGTPGSWTRCHRHLSKYMGTRAAGYCTNLCQRMGGYGVACHVGDKLKRGIKRGIKEAVESIA